MRKLILSMALAILSTSAYTQGTPVEKAVTGTTPSKTLTCDADNAQNPIVGKRYTYTVQGGQGKYHFFATNGNNFIQNKNLQLTGAYTDGGQIKVWTNNYNNANNTETSIDITWTNSANETSYLAVNHTPEAGCTTTNNLKVLKIKPKNAFFIELRNIEGNVTKEISNSSNVDVCLGAIKSASLSVSGDEMVYDYGSQSLFYELIAVNYDNSFVPEMKIAGLKNGQEATLKWGYNRDNMQVLKTVNSEEAIKLPKIVVDENVIPSNGVSIYLELEINNGKEEGLQSQAITLFADATTGTNNDIKNVKVTDCTPEDDFADKAIQTLKARAAITAGNGLNFMTTQP